VAKAISAPDCWLKWASLSHALVLGQFFNICRDTSHILFICGGTFVGLQDIIKKRIGHQLIGFANEENSVDETAQQKQDILSMVQPDDLIQFGMIPEFVGRLPVITALGPLDEQAMIRILTEPRNSLIKQYQRFFQMENTHLEFSPDAMRVIAHKAMKRDVGARALRAVIEDLMLSLMYELPDQKEDGAIYEITAEMVNNATKPSLFSARKMQKNTA